MALQYHPVMGTIVICDFKGLVPPEMVKRRPVIIMSPKLRRRNGLCTIVPLSTTPPKTIAPYHFRLHVNPPLPRPYTEEIMWVKADMIYTVSFKRLNLLFDGKDENGQRNYDVRVVDKADLLKIQQCMLNGLGLTSLTDYL